MRRKYFLPLLAIVPLLLSSTAMANIYSCTDNTHCTCNATYNNAPFSAVTITRSGIANISVLVCRYGSGNPYATGAYQANNQNNNWKQWTNGGGQDNGEICNSSASACSFSTASGLLFTKRDTH